MYATRARSRHVIRLTRFLQLGQTSLRLIRVRRVRIFFYDLPIKFRGVRLAVLLLLFVAPKHSGHSQVLDEKLYNGPPRVLGNFPIGSHADLASSTERSRVLIEHSRPLLNVPTVRGLGKIFERNMAPRFFAKRSNEFLASVWLVIIVLTAREYEDGSTRECFVPTIA